MAITEEYLKTLVDAVRSDESDRAEWRADQDEWRQLRLCENKRAKLPYPGAPDIREPIIDDTVTQLTSSEMSIMWNARTLAVFYPRTVAGLQFKRHVEIGFDTMLRQTLQIRSKIENLFDLKNERSMSVAKMIETTAFDGQTFPDVLTLEPEKVIVPTATTYIRDAERVCHEVVLSVRDFRIMAKKKGWSNVTEILARLDEKGKNKVGTKVVQGGDEIGNSVPDVTLWEIYHYGEDGESRWKTTIAKDVPELVLDSTEWKWKDKAKLTGEVDPFTGQPATTTIPGKPRRWPFVQFRYSNRTLRYHDIRGCAEKLKQDQEMAQANLNAKALMMEYACKPFTKGMNGKTFKYRPGENMPEGAEIVQMPRVDAIFDYNVNMAQANAARRVGAPNGALSSVDRTRDAKTAKEVSISALQNNQFSSDNVERFSEPLAELFTMMWEWLQDNRPKLAGTSGENFIEVPDAAYDQQYVIMSGANGKNANPDLILQQMMMMTQMFGMFPALTQVVKAAQFGKFLFDQVNPQISDLLIVDPAAAGPNGQAPIEQQVGQIMQLLRGGKNAEGQDEQGLVEQVQAQGQYLAAIAQHDAADTGQDGTGGMPK